MISVLLVTDVESGRLPDRCVFTGERTDTAVRIWAIESTKHVWLIGVLGYLGVLLARLTGRKTVQIGLPITQARWELWKRRTSAYAMSTSAGFGFVLVGILRPSAGFVILGLLVAALSRMARTRAIRNHWISAELKPEAGHILVGPTHPAFDEQARTLFRRSL